MKEIDLVFDKLKSNNPKLVYKSLGQVASIGFRKPEIVEKYLPLILKKTEDKNPKEEEC